MAEAAAGVLQAGDDPELSAAEWDCTALAALALKDGDGDGEEGHGEAPGGTQEQRKHGDKEAGEGKKSADAAGVTTRALDISRLVALDDAEAGDEVREHVSTLVHLSPDEQANLSAQMLKAREEARRQQAILRDEEVARGMQMEQDSARLEPIIHGVLAHLAPDQEKSRRQDGLVLRLERFVKGLYGAQATLEVFGSTVCQHAGKSSDLDVTLTPAFSHRLNLEEKKKVIRAVSKGLRGIGMHAQPILHARVPILQINASGVAVDLSVENELPVFKSRLLHEYTLLDHRFAQLVLLVKAWAKARQISSAQHGTFNSFGLSLLVLHYLQQLEPPVLPFLNRRDQGANRQPLHVDAPQRLAQCHADLVPTHRGARTTLGGEKIDVIHYTRDQLRDWRSQNSTRLVILLHGFFLYFARKFPWDSHVVTVTSPGPVAKSSVSVRSVNTGVIIQDPLDEHDNVARNIGRKTKMAVMHEFERAYSLDFGALLHEIRSAANSEAPAATRKRGPAAETRGGVGGDVVARATVEGEHMLQQETQEENMLTAADGSTRASAQRELAEKLAGCATLGDVLLVVESVPVGWWLSDTPNMERPQSIDLSMMLLDLYLDKQMAKQVAALHGIASRAWQRPEFGLAECAAALKDVRLQQLVMHVERKLQAAPDTFDPPHLARVVWSAARLGLMRPPIYLCVASEVVSAKRQLSQWSEEELGAIAWAYVAVGFNAPPLFQALLREAARRPALAALLIQAGLMPPAREVAGAIGVSDSAAQAAAPAESNVPDGSRAQAGGDRRARLAAAGDASGLERLAEMGFTDARENEEVLAQNGNDVSRAVDELMRRRFFRDKQASK